MKLSQLCFDTLTNVNGDEEKAFEIVFPMVKDNPEKFDDEPEIDPDNLYRDALNTLLADGKTRVKDATKSQLEQSGKAEELTGRIYLEIGKYLKGKADLI